MAITLAELNSLVMSVFPKDHPSLIRILFAWAEKDPELELAGYLNGTGLETKTMGAVLRHLMVAPADREDLDLLNKVILSEGLVTGWHLLNSLCDHPGHRFTHALIDAGLMLHKLRNNLASQPPKWRPAFWPTT
jgi:hypothetical protein